MKRLDARNPPAASLTRQSELHEIRLAPDFAVAGSIVCVAVAAVAADAGTYSVRSPDAAGRLQTQSLSHRCPVAAVAGWKR